MVFDELGDYYLQNIDTCRGSFSDLIISPRIANTARYICLPGGEQFESLENDVIDALVNKFSRRGVSGLVHGLESRWSTVVTSLVLVVAFSWFFVQYGVPYFSKSIAMMVPVETSKQLGQGVLKIMDRQWFGASELDKQRQTELQTLFVELVDKSDSPSYLRLELRKGNDLQANALALPDGTVVFTDELVQLAADDREIAAVMLHEIGHITYRHSLRSVIQQFSLALLIMAITGDVSTSSSAITAIPVLMVETGFSREMEWEADGYALQQLLALKIDPNYFAVMMEKISTSQQTPSTDNCPENNMESDSCNDENKPSSAKQEKTILDYLSTHPPSQERIDRFRNAGETQTTIRQ